MKLINLLKSFNSTAILASFVLQVAGVFSIILNLYLNDSDSIILPFGSSL